jgi:hypothetical protein
VYMQGLGQGLSSAAKVATEFPCTSLNIDCGLSSFLPTQIKNLIGLIKNPASFFLGKGMDAFLDPIYGLPSASIDYQFRMYSSSSGYMSYGGTVLGSYNNSGNVWSGPASSGK